MSEKGDPVVTDEMRQLIGQRSAPLHYEVESGACRMFAWAVGYKDRIFYESERARSAGYRDLPAPPGFFGHRLVIPGAGTPQGLQRFLDTPLKVRLDAGAEIEYLGDICAGDTLSGTSRLVSLEEKSGQSGPLLVSVTEFEYTNQNNELVAKSRHTVINR